VGEDVVAVDRDHDLPRRVGALVDVATLTGVAVSLGPGSFTGLRAGVSFGLGLALGRRLPLWGLDTLALQAARAREPATAVIEAGRGRVFWLAAGSSTPAHGEPSDLSRDLPAVGWLRPSTASALVAAGIRLLRDQELRTFAEAAAGQLQTADRLGYGTVSLRYSMDSSAALRGRSW
jgi:tRNA A37 threonylcarbamoyladenosine modification protein TsaB